MTAKRDASTREVAAKIAKSDRMAATFNSGGWKPADLFDNTRRAAKVLVESGEDLSAEAMDIAVANYAHRVTDAVVAGDKARMQTIADQCVDLGKLFDERMEEGDKLDQEEEEKAAAEEEKRQAEKDEIAGDGENSEETPIEPDTEFDATKQANPDMPQRSAEDEPEAERGDDPSTPEAPAEPVNDDAAATAGTGDDAGEPDADSDFDAGTNVDPNAAAKATEDGEQATKRTRVSVEELDIGEGTKALLVANGYTTARKILDASDEKLEAIDGIGKKLREKIKAAAEEATA